MGEGIDEREAAMTPEEVVRAELAAWDHLDVDEIMSHFALDAVWENVPVRAVSGYDEIRKEVKKWLSPMTSFDAEILNLAVAGNVVLTERVDHTDFHGQLFHARVMGAFEVDGDKIKAWRDYFDMPKDGR
jgi:limonene-1,2-epoxide hydrolase